jgi:DNA-binding MarR family transcriptional regulator
MADLRPEDSLGFQVRRCHRAFDRVLNAHLAKEGLTSGFWYFLRALWREDGATQKRLSQLNNVSEPTTVTAITGMTRIGLVTRRRNTEDARKINILLTPRGHALKGELMPAAIRINDIASAGIPAKDLRTCLSVLDRMSENLSREMQASPGAGKRG